MLLQSTVSVADEEELNVGLKDGIAHFRDAILQYREAANSTFARLLEQPHYQNHQERIAESMYDDRRDVIRFYKYRDAVNSMFSQSTTSVELDYKPLVRRSTRRAAGVAMMQEKVTKKKKEQVKQEDPKGLEKEKGKRHLNRTIHKRQMAAPSRSRGLASVRNCGTHGNTSKMNILGYLVNSGISAGGTTSYMKLVDARSSERHAMRSKRSLFGP